MQEFQTQTKKTATATCFYQLKTIIDVEESRTPI